MIYNGMLNIIKNRIGLFNLLKLLWAVIILYLGIKLSVYYIWENTNLAEEEFYNTQKTGQQNFDEERKEVVDKHDVAPSEQESVVDQLDDLDWEKNEYQMKFQATCLANISFCTKIKFQWDFTYKDKYMYLATSIYVLNHINENAQFGKDIKTQLKKINISNEVWSRRWFANWDTVTINLWNVSSYVEFLELMAHEIWHVVDLGMIRWFSNKKSNIYTEFSRSVLEIDDPSIEFYKLSWQSEKIRDSEAEKEDFCSGYGMTNPFEDLAECHNLYLNHNSIFREWAKNNEIMRNKYNFLANLYGWVYLFDSSKDLERIKNNPSWKPWDTTKM